MLFKGIRFVVDEAGQKPEVIISPKANPEQWEDIYDRPLARKPEAEAEKIACQCDEEAARIAPRGRMVGPIRRAKVEWRRIVAYLSIRLSI